MDPTHHNPGTGVLAEGHGALVREALTRAGSPGTPDKIARQLDREAVGMLLGAANLDELLAAIDLDALAGLVDRSARPVDDAAEADRRLAWDALDLIRRSAVLRRIPRPDLDAWSLRILAAVEASHLTVGPLFRQRAETYGSKVLFEIPQGQRRRALTWRHTASRVEFLARGLLSLDSAERPAPIAILSDNRLEMALVDLACLSAGLVNVMVPANATEVDIGYMLRHSEAGAVVVSDARLLEQVRKQRDSLPHLRRIIAIDPSGGIDDDVLTLDDLATRAAHIPGSLVVSRSEAVRIDDTATIMYTSGTTGTPKGIEFSHRNLVFKRFARALALPEIGDQDRFLCFLPLFHTFGRFLELLGCVFWGATYTFLEQHSSEGLVNGMREFRPTVFISVPKKWIQLYESIIQEADPQTAGDAELAAATRAATGGRLRWGLSAAGHLDSDIFKFFQQQGVNLLSGFGMTEATGGITMTLPDNYREGSLGVALPGIELKLAEDRELLVRGPYVMTGYFRSPDGEPSFDAEGWLHTGDLMETDRDGHLRLIDRKKEIYKNVKGETIAPQRVEAHFRDFESVERAFLVGDHRPYNTLLIYPRPQYAQAELASMTEQEVWDHFRSLVVSVNKFLAPYERVVDFAVIDRDLSEDRGELTAKGTPRRSVVVRNFDDVIRTLYRRTNVKVGGVELTLPNWLFQALGLTSHDVRVEGDRLVLPSSGRSLVVRSSGAGIIRVGDCLYRPERSAINLGTLMTSPRLWLGNGQLVDFVDVRPDERIRPGRSHGGINWEGYAEVAGDDSTGLVAGSTGLAAALQQALDRGEPDLMDLDVAARALATADEHAGLLAVRLAEDVLEHKAAELRAPARLVLGRANRCSSADIARRAFRVLVRNDLESRFPHTLKRFLTRRPDLLDEATRSALAHSTLAPEQLEAFITATREVCLGQGDWKDDPRLAPALLDLLSRYGALHPVSYRRLRATLTRMFVVGKNDAVRVPAEAAARSMLAGFRGWLGDVNHIAVDPETGGEYGWEDVVAFDDGVSDEDRTRLLAAIKSTSMLREAVFLFSTGTLIHLSDIPPGGVWIRELGSRHGKTVHRITVQTRFVGAYDLAVNLNHSLPAEEVNEEIQWLVISGDPGERSSLVEDFGGYWPEHDLWTEEFISGETLDHAMSRLARQKDRAAPSPSSGGEALVRLWPFLARSTLGAYVDFWHRSGKHWEIADPSLSNVVVPTEDYLVGARLVSLSARRTHRGLPAMLQSFREQFVEPAEAQYPELKGHVGWPAIFSAVLEIVGEAEGLLLLDQARETAEPGAFGEALREFIKQTRLAGFLPMRAHFAVERYREWETLSGDPTLQARARTLQELYETYGLQRLTASYPELRFRYFRGTVLRDAPPALAAGLDEIVDRLRSGRIHEDEVVDAVADLRAHLELGPEQDYFLARISFPHLRPEDTADFVSSHLGGRDQSEIVVALEDRDGAIFRVRHALNPKEVERLHRLFLAAKLEVRFRAEHHYLVALNERNQIIGGIYYEIEEDGSSAHLEKIVAAERYRRMGVADGLMTEFFNRLRAAGVSTVTTGFFRPQYFYAHGFRIEKRYAGLVKSLAEKESRGQEPS